MDLAVGTLEENMDLVCMASAVAIQEILEEWKAVVLQEAHMDLQENWVDKQEDVLVADLKVDQMVEVACKYNVKIIFFNNNNNKHEHRLFSNTTTTTTTTTARFTHTLTQEVEGLVVADLVFYSRDICL